MTTNIKHVSFLDKLDTTHSAKRDQINAHSKNMSKTRKTTNVQLQTKQKKHQSKMSENKRQNKQTQ